MRTLASVALAGLAVALLFVFLPMHIVVFLFYYSFYGLKNTAMNRRKILTHLVAPVVFGLLVYAILWKNTMPKSVVDEADSSYDYIVVGAGTAGCVVASKLSENPNAKVLLVEAGGFMKWFTSIPLLAPFAQRTEMDWKYESTRQKYSSKGLFNRVQFLPRGKGLGGSGHINYMFHSLGRATDYSSWPTGWKYPELEQHFRAAESRLQAHELTGEEGLAEATRLAARANGQRVYVPARATTRRGSRRSSLDAYLRLAWQRDNLHVLPETLVTKILIDEKNKATGIQIRYRDGSLANVLAKKQIVLCGGAIGTPQLLMVSGIGSKTELKKHKINVKVELPAVGQNYFDHLNMPMYVKLKAQHKTLSITWVSLVSLSTFKDYFFDGTGLLTTNGIIGTVQSNDSGVILAAIGTIDEKSLKDFSNYKTETFRGLFPTYNDTESNGFLMLTTCLQPKSRGRISLQSDQMTDPPLIDPNYLSKDEDVRCHLHAMRTAKEITESAEFQEYGASLQVPALEECKKCARRDYGDDDYATCLLRTGALTGHHPAGTCRMGDEPTNSVVDSKLKVHGIEGLRIVDASILPSPISGPPNSVLVAIAEKASDIVLSEA